MKEQRTRREEHEKLRQLGYSEEEIKQWRRRLAIRLHAARRAHERFHIELTQEESEKILDLIEHTPRTRRRFTSDAAYLHTHPDGRELYAVRRGRVWIPLVYSPKLREIVTFLPVQAMLEFDFVPPSIEREIHS